MPPKIKSKPKGYNRPLPTEAPSKPVETSVKSKRKPKGLARPLPTGAPSKPAKTPEYTYASITYTKAVVTSDGHIIKKTVRVINNNGIITTREAI